MPETTPAPTAQPARSGVFRKQAIERQSAPSDQLDQLLRVTPARGWVALLALCAVVLAAIGYGLLGTIPTTVSGQGVFLPPGGLTRIDASVAGTVSAIDVRVGDPVTRGAAVATIVDARAKENTVRSTLSGTVTEVLIDDGNFVSPGTELVVVEPTADAVTAVLYVPAGQGKAVGRGMDVHLSPSTAPSEQYGQVLGTVASISEFPVSSERLEFVLQNDILVDQISRARIGARGHRRRDGRSGHRQRRRVDVRRRTTVRGPQRDLDDGGDHPGVGDARPEAVRSA